jgi:hypothetical protein
MRYYSVYVKDLVKRRFWTVDVEAEDNTPAGNILKYASAVMYGGDAIGFKEFLTPMAAFGAAFYDGRVVEGLSL